MEWKPIKNKWGADDPSNLFGQPYNAHRNKTNTIGTKLTTSVEDFHRQIRKVTNTKEAFINHMALQKVVYLTLRNLQKNWISALNNWSLTVQQLYSKVSESRNVEINANANVNSRFRWASF